MTKGAVQQQDRQPWKLLLWTAVAGLIFGLIGFGEIAEDALRVIRNDFHRHSASGQVVVVGVDEHSLRQFGNWPWPRRYDAAMVDRLSRLGARRIFFDLNFSYATNPADDAAFAQAIERSGRVSLFVRSKFGAAGNVRKIGDRPLDIFRKHARLTLGSAEYNYQNAVWKLPYAAVLDGQKIPSIAAALADVDGPPDGTFRLDYSIQQSSIPTISAADLLIGRVPPSALRGKDVIIAVNSEILNDVVFIPGHGRGFGAYVQAIGAETLRHGRPRDLGWVPAFLLALVIAGLALRQRSGREQAVLLTAAMLFLVVGPTALETQLIFVDITPGLFVLLVIAGALARRHYRSRGLVNPVSLLANLNALRTHRDGRKRALVAARVFNYEEILATLPAHSERELVEQIKSRITVGSNERRLYQGDGGIFAWFDEPHQAFGNHLEALYALFRNPARVAGRSIDLTIAFGVEVGSSRSLGNRLASALVAAEEAAHAGLKWKYHDPETLEDASWKLSMLSQLDDAIDQGQVWVAFQPKLELATRRVIGAEALARWTHPDKGPIAASEFVAAAEQHNRIAKLTDFVLEKAVSAAATINKRGISFNIAVNLSARLLSDKGFTLRLSALLARNGLAPCNLTLELTETAALAGSGEALDMLAQLRALGVRVSIDDYGTGLSTLEYLKKIPADEIKIDQSFVKGIADSRSDRLMVQSTIGLAHSLDRKVVAEGVEQRDILELLIQMDCDVAQGFAIGRPMSLESLAKRIGTERKRSAA